MRIILITLILSTICFKAYSQTDTIIVEYLGKYDKKTTSGKVFNGRRIGKWETKFQNKLLFECFYNWPDSNLLYKGFDNDGFLEEQSFKYYLNDTTLIRNGYFEHYSYNHNNKILSCGYYKMGKLHNQYNIFFLDTNAMYLKCFFDNGIKVDSSYLFYENGQIEEIGFYKNWERIGLWKEYYANGQLRAFGHYLGVHKKIFVDKIVNPVALDYVTVSEPYDYKKGIWNYYLPNGKMYKKEVYSERGELLKCNEWLN